MQSSLFTISALALPLMFGACAEQENTELPADTAATEPMPVPAAGQSTADTLHVELREWQVDPQRDTVPAGRVVFHVMNQGQYQHALEVEGGGEEKETKTIAGGGVATLEMELKPGTYELYCPVEDTHGEHEELGMRTTLVVR